MNTRTAIAVVLRLRELGNAQRGVLLLESNLGRRMDVLCSVLTTTRRGDEKRHPERCSVYIAQCALRDGTQPLLEDARFSRLAASNSSLDHDNPATHDAIRRQHAATPPH